MKQILIFSFALMAAAGTVAGQGSEAVLYGLGPSVQPDQADRIYRIDRNSGTPIEIGSTGATGCEGLAFNRQGRLVTACFQTGGFFLRFIDPDSGAVQQGPKLERRLPDPLVDLAFRSEDEVLAALVILICELCDPRPPLPAAVSLLDPNDGSKLQIAFAGSGSPPPISPIGFREGTLYGIRTNAEGDSTILSIDLNDSSVGPPTDLSMDGPYDDLAFDPQSGRAHAVLPNGEASSLLVTIDEDGQVETAAELPLPITSIAFSHPIQPPPSVEWILPILTLTPSDDRNFKAMLTVLNQAESTAVASIQVFDDSGVRPEPLFQYTPPICDAYPFRNLLPVEYLGENFVVPARQSAAVVFDNGPEPFSGWVRLRRVGPQELHPHLEIVYLVPRTGHDCFSLESNPSRQVLTAATVPAVRPSLEFSAVGTITGSRESGFAIVNPSPVETARITIQADHLDGEAFDSNEIELAPRHRLNLLLFDLLNRGKQFVQPPQRPTFFTGPVRFTSDVPIAVGALNVQLPEGKWVNLPVVSN